MTENLTPRPIFLAEIEEATRNHELGPWFVDRAIRTDDGRAAYQIIRDVSDLVRRLGAVPEEPEGAPVGRRGLTDTELTFLGRFRLGDHEGVTGLLVRDGWTARRVQKELLSLLRLMISLDPDQFSEFDVVVAADEIADVDAGRKIVPVVVQDRLSSIPRDTMEGTSFRHGLALGLRLARQAESDATLSRISAQIDDDLGVTAPDQRPPRIA